MRNQIRDNNKMNVLTVGGHDDSGAFGVLLHGDSTDVSYNTITNSAAFSHDFGHDGAAIEVYGGRYNHVHHNTAVDNDAFVELGNARSSDNTFAYNVVRSWRTDSIFLISRGAGSGWGPIYRTRAYNNSVVLTGSNSQGFVCDSGCDGSILSLRNNVIQAVAKVGYADRWIDEDFNVFWGGRVQFNKGGNSVIADPGFVDARNGNLRLYHWSPAVDRGIGLGYNRDLDGVAVPRDGNGDGRWAPDAGAYER